MTTTEQALEVELARLDNTEREAIWQHGWTTGHHAALTARPPATVHVPVPVPWRHVRPGDTFAGARDTLWHVQALDHTPYPDEDAGTVEVTAVCGAQTFAVAVHGDEQVHVLHPVLEADAITCTEHELGAILIERRTA